jgi:starch-binding outer membrane protein, SusD/RagB family
MKYYITRFLSFLIISSLITSGCNKKLDVEPQQNITPDQIRTEGDVLAVLYGTYSLLQNVNGFGERYLLVPDLLAAQGHVKFVGTFRDHNDIFKKQQIATNGIAQGIWANAYSVINALNTVLSKTDLVNADDRDAIIAEAKFLRGLVYFELVQFFGKPYSAGNTNTNLAVPLQLEPVFDYVESRDKKARSTVGQVYTQVIADLSAAATDLPESTDGARPSKYAASAILSRVYMNQAKYDSAATAANTVIESNNFALTGYYGDAFNVSGSPGEEDIFSILQTSQSNAGTANAGLTTLYLARTSTDPSIPGGGRGDVQVEASYLTNFEAFDDRRNFFYNGTSIAGAAGIYTIKWAFFYRNITVVRLAEMYLTRAEANYRKGGAPIGPNTPLQDVNIVRGRSNASPLVTIASGTVFVDERFRELGFEGDRLNTLKRLQLNVDGRPYNDNLLVLPIPRRERDVNANLEQNAGYN